jgi:hypothetical protein
MQVTLQHRVCCCSLSLGSMRRPSAAAVSVWAQCAGRLLLQSQSGLNAQAYCRPLLLQSQSGLNAQAFCRPLLHLSHSYQQKNSQFILLAN